MYSIARRFQEEPEKAEKRPAISPQPQGGTKEIVLVVHTYQEVKHDETQGKIEA
jgi:hypothetical protein